MSHIYGCRGPLRRTFASEKVCGGGRPEPSLRILRIVEGTSVDGVGLRTSIYGAGCDNRCAGCHNPQSWDPAGGEPMSVRELADRVAEAGLNVTFSGGDPMFQAAGFAALARAIRRVSDKTIWCYTGLTYERIMACGGAREVLLRSVDVLVDGPFVLTERDTSLLFRGSRNQRIIDVAASLAAGRVVELDLTF